jgi:hypothetical protein
MVTVMTGIDVYIIHDMISIPVITVTMSCIMYTSIPVITVTMSCIMYTSIPVITVTMSCIMYTSNT